MIHHGSAAGLAQVLEAIPTNWVDPLLTGPTAVIGRPPYDCPDIERLLLAIKQRIEAVLAAPALAPSPEKELEEAARRAFVILEGLRLAVDWELHPSIKAAIAKSAKELFVLLAASRPADPQEPQ